MYDFASKQAQSFELKKSLSDSPKLKPEAGTQASLEAIRPVNKPELKPELKSGIRPEFKPDPEASIAFDALPGLLKFLTPTSSDDIVSAEEWKVVGTMRDEMIKEYRATGQNPFITTTKSLQNGYPKTRWRLIWVMYILLGYELSTDPSRLRASLGSLGSSRCP